MVNERLDYTVPYIVVRSPRLGNKVIAPTGYHLIEVRSKFQSVPSTPSFQ
jgi:hypothetical protein